MSSPTERPSIPAAPNSAPPAAPVPAPPASIPYPGDELADESRRMAIARRELQAFSQHVQRSRQLLLAHYDQMAWMQQRLAERENKLRNEEQKLGAARGNLEQRQRDADQRHLALDRRQRDLDDKQQEVEQRQKEVGEWKKKEEERVRAELEQLRRSDGERRTAELAEMDRRRQQHQDEIAAEKKRIAEQRAELEKLRQETEAAQKQHRERLTADTAEMEKNLKAEAAQIAHDRQDIAQAETGLQKRRDELARMMDELKQAQSTQKQGANLELDSLRREVEALRAQLAQRDKDRSETAERTARDTAAFAANEAGLRRQIDSLRSDLGARPSRPPAPEPMPDEELAVESAESDEQLVELPPFDLASFEEQLSEFRKLLQSDRHAIEEDVQNLQTHRGEELKAQPQRAPLTAEAARLNQLRHEIQQEMDRLHRERPDSFVDSGSASQTPSKKPVAPATKSRGTFLGLRRWLTGG